MLLKNIPNKLIMKKPILLLFLILYTGISAQSQKTQLLHFYVEAGDYQRVNTPVSVDIEGVDKSDTLGFQLFEKAKGQLSEKKIQVETGYIPRIWWILDGTTGPGKKSFSCTKISLNKFLPK
jgi:hypothetical protein